MVNTIKKRHSIIDDIVKSMHLGGSAAQQSHTGTISYSILLQDCLMLVHSNRISVSGLDQLEVASQEDRM